MSTVIVTGSRDWADEDGIWAALSRAVLDFHVTHLVHGGAKGADRIAGEWAQRASVHVQVYRADWEQFGKGAGTLRNLQMLEAHPDAMVVGFPLPASKGTVHCLLAARKLGMPVWVPYPKVCER